MFLVIIRFIFLVLMVLAGIMIVVNQQFEVVTMQYLTGGALAGLVIGLIIIYCELLLKRIVLSRLVWSIIGLFLGGLVARFLFSVLGQIPWIDGLALPLYFILSVIFGYSGLMVGYLHYESFAVNNIMKMFRGNQSEKNFKILDTSVIIDGRIADICETGFLDGTLIIPQFVLKELQHIADSSDMLKRNRGRRGLDILQKIQKLADVNVEIVETDFPKVREVDAKLVELGKTIGGKILTNDFNLNKIAELQGISVLNVNELANALKPVVLPGELMRVHVLKEGKEIGQGVAYLDDGTMVVVDNAINAIGKDVEVSVTSVLQTTAGRMIFSRLKEILEV